MSFLILYSDTRGKHPWCLINKTAGLQYFFVMFATRDFHTSAMMVYRYCNSDGYISLGPYICCVQPQHCVFFIGRSWQNILFHVVVMSNITRVKAWSSWPIMSSIPYYFFEMSECSWWLFFCSQNSRGHIFTLEKAKKDFFFFFKYGEQYNLKVNLSWSHRCIRPLHVHSF